MIGRRAAGRSRPPSSREGATPAGRAESNQRGLCVRWSHVVMVMELMMMVMVMMVVSDGRDSSCRACE